MPSYITSIGTANPGEAIPQSQIADFMLHGLELTDHQQNRLKLLYRATGIRQRFSVIPDYGLNGKPFQFYNKTKGLEPFPTVKQRMHAFRESALNLSVEAINDCCKNPEEVTHLITVSCTGMYAPGLDIELVEKLKLKPNVERTAVNFMGCYAAFSALKIAQRITHFDPDAKVLVVCVELCSLHFQKTTDEETILANALFGDGAAAVLIEANAAPGGLSIDGFFCDIEPDGKKEMTWGIGDFGFEMRLSEQIPELIEKKIELLTTNLLQKIDLNVNDIDHFAIHPGGKKILEVIEDKLGIPRGKNSHSFDVLRNYGNMSSPSVLFVLKSIMEDLNGKDSGDSILSFAFGPGLTMESMLLSVN
ncbi:MAG: type III polyketide synthase [Cyclobacteriaceae bacterium]